MLGVPDREYHEEFNRGRRIARGVLITLALLFVIGLGLFFAFAPSADAVGSCGGG